LKYLIAFSYTKGMRDVLRNLDLTAGQGLHRQAAGGRSQTSVTAIVTKRSSLSRNRFCDCFLGAVRLRIRFFCEIFIVSRAVSFQLFSTVSGLSEKLKITT
jgi:hypothetical protein